MSTTPEPIAETYVTGVDCASPDVMRHLTPITVGARTEAARA